MSWATLGHHDRRHFSTSCAARITDWTFWVGVIKAPFFAAIIAMVGCYEGFNVTGSAEASAG